MKTSTRRQFLKQTSTALAASSFGLAQSVRAASPNERIVLGFIGPGGQGTNLLRSFAPMSDVAIAYVCDADSKRAQAAAKNAEQLSKKAPKIVKDMREILDAKDVDAV